MMTSEKENSGITRTGIGERLKPVCESIVSSTLTSRTCKFCGKEHDGSYGSGKFCSDFCAHAYVSRLSAKNASKRNKEKLGIKCQCKFCGENFDAKIDLKKHLSVCPKRQKYKRNRDWKCKYCGKVFETRKVLFEHIKNCSEYLNLPKNSLGRIIPVYDRSLVMKKTIKKLRSKGRVFGHPHTEKTKKHLSEIRRKNLENGVGNHWICPSIKRSYAEQYFFDCFKKANLEFENNVWVGHYCLDFKVGNNYFEVDGEQHYTEEGLAKDKRRTEFLLKKGLTLVARCRWKDFIKLSFEEKENYLKSIIEKLNKIC